MVKIIGCERSKIKNKRISSMKNDFWGYVKEVEAHEPFETFKFTCDKKYRFNDKISHSSLKMSFDK